jgi:hypothetical protein
MFLGGATGPAGPELHSRPGPAGTSVAPTAPPPEAPGGDAGLTPRGATGGAGVAGGSRRPLASSPPASPFRPARGRCPAVSTPAGGGTADLSETAFRRGTPPQAARFRPTPPRHGVKEAGSVHGKGTTPRGSVTGGADRAANAAREPAAAGSARAGSPVVAGGAAGRSARRSAGGGSSNRSGGGGAPGASDQPGSPRLHLPLRTGTAPPVPAAPEWKEKDAASGPAEGTPPSPVLWRELVGAASGSRVAGSAGAALSAWSEGSAGASRTLAPPGMPVWPELPPWDEPAGGAEGAEALLYAERRSRLEREQTGASWSVWLF